MPLPLIGGLATSLLGSRAAMAGATALGVQDNIHTAETTAQAMFLTQLQHDQKLQVMRLDNQRAMNNILEKQATNYFTDGMNQTKNMQQATGQAASA